jgi:Domain of unknown function (DUF4157)
MNATLETSAKSAGANKPLSPVPAGVVQRHCASCGSTALSGECEDCKNKQAKLRRYPVHRPLLSHLLPSFAAAPRVLRPLGPAFDGRSSHNFGVVRVHPPATPATQARRDVSEPGVHEQEADGAAQQVRGSLEQGARRLRLPRLSVTAPLVQRMPADERAASRTPLATTATPEAGPDRADLIAEDEAGDLGPRQMRRTEFLDELRKAVCAAADSELAAVGRTAQVCPYIEHWIGYYRTRDGQYLERAIRRYAPDAAAATTAQDYIPLITERVRRAVAVWAKTGEITGIPEGASAAPPEAGSSEEGKTTSNATSGLQFKDAAGGAKSADNPAAVRAQLNGGQLLDNGVRSRMESAFGYDFSRVRVHTDAKAAGLSSRLNARAFTVGSDVAFASGEYRPGTLVGDALIAHELAHVAQQQAAASEPMRKGGGEYNGLEEDADRSAVGAVVSLWSGAKSGMANIAANAMPRLKAGLRLQRCDSSSKAKQGPITPTILEPDYISPRIYKGCGEFHWFIDWFTNGRIGFIVQEITNTYNAKDCTGAADTSDAPTPHFYEAWEVDEKGQVLPIRFLPERMNDKWSRPARTEANGNIGSQGDWSITGKLYWTTTLDPAASFSVGAVYDAGDLLSTTKRPNNLGKAFKEHKAAGKWNCCGGASDHNPVN